MTPDQLQAQHREWSVRNFGEHPAWQPLLGMVEEAGELAEAMGDREEWLDAVGDIVIFLVDYCSTKGWSFGTIWELRTYYNPSGRPLQEQLGRLCHHELKSCQGIRGNASQHASGGRQAASSLLAYLDRACTSMGVSLWDVVCQTWAEVSKREWRAAE